MTVSARDIENVVLVGGGLAAIRAAELLRTSGFAGAVTIVSDEPHLPYDRPPLSKDVLRGELDDVALKPPSFYGDAGITVRLGVAAKSLDTTKRKKSGGSTSSTRASG